MKLYYKSIQTLMLLLSILSLQNLSGQTSNSGLKIVKATGTHRVFPYGLLESSVTITNFGTLTSAPDSLYVAKWTRSSPTLDYHTVSDFSTTKMAVPALRPNETYTVVSSFRMPGILSNDVLSKVDSQVVSILEPYLILKSAAMLSNVSTPYNAVKAKQAGFYYPILPASYADLALSGSQINTTWDSVNRTIELRLRVTNNGPSPAQNIFVEVNRADAEAIFSLTSTTTSGFVQTSGGGITTTKKVDLGGRDGRGYQIETWNIPYLPAGSSIEATFRGKVITLTSAPQSNTYYYKDMKLNPKIWYTDVQDNTSTNDAIAGGFTYRFVRTTPTTAPDLALANLTVPTPSVQQGQILNFKTDIKNIGTAAAAANFTIKSYLSTDNILSTNDYQNGVIPTANLAAGQIVTQVAGAMTVNTTVPAGQYYLILKVDADNTIAESNENNNVIVRAGLVTVTAATGTCSNITSGGDITGNENRCVPPSNVAPGTGYYGTTIRKVTSATGGTGALEYVWVRSTTAIPTAITNGTIISGETKDSLTNFGLSAVPSFINQTSYFRRFARRAGCTTYVPSVSGISKIMQTQTGPRIICPNDTTVIIPSTTTCYSGVLQSARTVLSGCNLGISGMSEIRPTACLPIGVSSVTWRVNYANGSYNNCIYKVTVQPTQTATKLVRVALVISDPFVPNTTVRFHQRFNWLDPLTLSRRLRDSLNAASHGKVNYQLSVVYDELKSYTLVNGNPLSVDTLNKWYNEPGWTTIHSYEHAGQITYNYNKLLSDYRFCEKRDSGIIDEVWVYTYPIAGTWESTQAGNGAFWLNSEPVQNTTCQNLLVIMGLNYERGVAEALHSYGHRTESVMRKVYGRWDYAANPKNNWEKFSSYNFVTPGQSHIGNIHFPPNAVADYQYSETSNVTTYADNWANYPNLGTSSRTISCREWNCTQEGFMMWWYRHLPHFDCVNPTDGKLNNWWHYVVDYNDAIRLQNAPPTGNCGAVPGKDIALSITSTPSVYKQWTNQSFTISAKNLGSQAFTNVNVQFKFPTNTTNGGTATPSVGTWNVWCAGGVQCNTWTIPTLAANSTATLTVPVYVLGATGGMVATTTLLSSTPADVNAANNTATITVSPATAVAAQIQAQATQLIPIVIQRIAPNPSDGEVIVELESLDNREIQFDFSNAMGSTIHSEKRVVEKGQNHISFDISQLPQGIYFVAPNTNQGRKVPTKFVKL